MSDLPPSDPAAARLLAGVLAPGETLLWAGRPDARRFARTDGRLVGLGVFWTAVSGAGFAGFGVNFLTDEFAGVAVGARIAFLVLAAAPFVLVAAYCLGGHVLVRRRARERTAYAVTRTRILVLRPSLAGTLGASTLRELPVARAAEPTIEDLRHGTGTIEIHDATQVERPLRFDAVAGVEQVAALLHAQRMTGT